MSKYNFDDLNPLEFESLIKALIDHRFRTSGALTQFGPGRDGGREATWTQPSTHPDFSRIKKSPKAARRRWVFQAKFHDYKGSRTRQASSQVAKDLSSELNKITNSYKSICDSYVMITNASLSGIHRTGGKDLLAKSIKRWGKRIEDIQVWDAADLSAMLDSAPEVRTTYLAKILPGDVLAELLSHARQDSSAAASALRAYLRHVLQSAGAARTDEAGDESERQLRLEDIFIDLSVMAVPVRPSQKDEAGAPGPEAMFDEAIHERGPVVGAASALLSPPAEVTLLEAGPGYGKSTICQFLAVLNAARIVDPQRAERLASRMTMLGNTTYKELDAECRPRVPFRIELRRYADARAQRVDGLASYIATELINPAADCAFTKDDVYRIVSRDPCLVILDGLDEVPNAALRGQIVQEAETLHRRATASPGADLLMIVSTRPQGYHGEFDTLAGAKFQIRDLSPKEFANYCDAWLAQRVPDVDERADAKARVERGMAAPEVARLAATLLQATVILTIARNKHDIPHERSRLFNRYVDVIFQRETTKHRLVKEYEAELRQLHQDVAYAMHSAMEAGQAGNMSLEEFRQHVVRVWLKLRGTEPQDRSLRPLLEQFIDVAKDRLVFLRGEGPEQEQIGFLLSSFREFFSALYLAGHEEADRQGVFRALFQRDWHWENVLLFYAGLQGAADQKSWLSYLSDRDDAPPAEQIYTAVRFRYLLGKLLPELRGLTKKTYESAVRQAFASESLWAWASATWMQPILGSVRGGLGVTVAVDACLSALADGSATPAAAIGACAAIVHPKHAEWARIRDAIGTASTSPAIRDAALRAAVRHDVVIPVQGASVSEWENALEAERSYGDALEVVASSLAPGVAIELFVRNYWTTMGWRESNKFIGALSRQIEHGMRPISGRNTAFGIVLRPYLARSRVFRDAQSVKSSFEQQGVIESRYAQYLLALDAANRSGVEQAAWTVAANLERELGLGPQSYFAVAEQLGPGPAEFPAVSDWAEFRRAIQRMHSRADGCLDVELALGASGGVGGILSLLFHPDAWDEWARQGMVDGGVVGALRGTNLHDVLKRAPVAADLGSLALLSEQRDSDDKLVSLSEFMNAAVAIGRSYGPRAFGPLVSFGVSHLLRCGTHGARAQAREALQLFTGDQPRWDLWRSLALVNALFCDGVGLDEIEAFWTPWARERMPLAMPRVVSGRHVRERVCESSASDSFKLFVVALFGEPYEGPAAEALARAAVLELRAKPSGAWRSVAWRALGYLPWTSEEVEFWIGQPEPLLGGPYVLQQLARRIHAVAEDADQRRSAPAEAVARFVEAAQVLPHQVSRAALQRYATLRRASTPKLCETDWARSGG